MSEKNVVEINNNRIVLTNLDVLSLITAPSMKTAFDKIQTASSVSGKLQYWVYKLSKKIFELYKDFEEVRVKLAKEFCDKEEDGSLTFTDSQYQFAPDKKTLYDAEIQNLVHINVSEEEKNREIEQIALKYCKRDKNNNPIKFGGNNLSFSTEGRDQFNVAYSDLLIVENVISIDIIKIDSMTLEKMNNKLDNPINVNDMIALEKIFEFVE